MKKIALIALATASLAAMASPAAAQSVTGTVNLTGSVADKCLVLPGAGSDFGATIPLGELAGADGRLRASDTIESQINGVAGTSARVVCTTANPLISIDTTALATTATAVSGYDNSIDFNAIVTVTTTGTNSGPFANDSSAAPLVEASIGSRLANNGNSNVVITTDNFRTGDINDLLVASPTYSGSIVVVIAPGV